MVANKKERNYDVLMPKNKEDGGEMLRVRLTPDLKALAEKWARKDQRDLSSFIRKAIVDEAEKLEAEYAAKEAAQLLSAGVKLSDKPGEKQKVKQS